MYMVETSRILENHLMEPSFKVCADHTSLYETEQCHAVTQTKSFREIHSYSQNKYKIQEVKHNLPKFLQQLRFKRDIRSKV